VAVQLKLELDFYRVNRTISRRKLHTKSWGLRDGWWKVTRLHGALSLSKSLPVMERSSRTESLRAPSVGQTGCPENASSSAQEDVRISRKRQMILGRRARVEPRRLSTGFLARRRPWRATPKNFRENFWTAQTCRPQHLRCGLKKNSHTKLLRFWLGTKEHKGYHSKSSKFNDFFF
jgi:hypothetical protein